MQTVFKVHLRPGVDGNLNNLQGTQIISVELLDSQTVRLTVAGNGIDAERALRAEKNIVIAYQRLRQLD